VVVAPLQGFFDGGFITRGCAPLYPGLSHFAPSGLRSRKKVGPFDKLRDRGTFGTVSELAELAGISCARVKDTAWG